MNTSNNTNPDFITHTRDFSVDKAILRNLILQQAGSLQKAIIELVMNEIDAKATRVDITISNTLRNITVSGNGRGFTSLEAIEKRFGTFGFNHDCEEEMALDRRYGRYGLGRGQIFAFGKTQWLTNQFGMTVDFQSWDPKVSDMPYTIQEFKTSQNDGCKIDIELYKPMAIFERNYLETDLKNMMRYTPQAVYLNGTQLNSNPEDVKWTAKNEHLRFKLSSGGNGGLRIYNEGVFVCTLSHSRFGISGDLTSVGMPFDVNMARNDIQQATCKLWAGVKAFLSPLAEKKSRASLTDEDREYLLKSFISGDKPYTEIRSIKLFRMITGSYLSLDAALGYANGRITLSPTAFSNTGTNIHKLKQAAVFSPAILTMLNVNSLDELMCQLKTAFNMPINTARGGEGYYASLTMNQIKACKIIPYEQVTQAYKGICSTIPESELTPLDKCKLKGLNTMNSAVAQLFFNTSPRKIMVGDSDTALAWTDSVSYVAVKRELFKDVFSGGMPALLNMIAILIHEYRHDRSSAEDHEHDLDFYMGFHDLTLNRHRDMVQIAQKSFVSYNNARKKSGIGVLKSELTEFTNYFYEYIISELNGTPSDKENREHDAA